MNDAGPDKRIDDLERRVKVLERYHTNTPLPHHEKDLSLGEFIETLVYKGYNDLTVAIGYFKEVYEKTKPLTSSLIEAGYKEIKELRPKNFPDTIYRAVKNHLFREGAKLEDGTRPFALTNKGIEYVEKKLMKTQDKVRQNS